MQGGNFRESSRKGKNDVVLSMHFFGNFQNNVNETYIYWKKSETLLERKLRR